MSRGYATWDPVAIDRAFGWAQAMGMNTMRVFFHDPLWQQDPQGFKARIDAFIGIAKTHRIRQVRARENRYNVAMMDWGFVDGKTQTRFPCDSWYRPYTQSQPTIWCHDVLKADGSPYRQAEVDLIERMAGAPKSQLGPVGKDR